MRFTRSLQAAAVLVGVVGTAAGAQGSTRPLQLVVAGGAAVPTGGFKDYHDLGVQADVGVLINVFGRSLRLRPQVTYARFKLKDALQYQTALQTLAGGAVVARDVVAGYGSEQLSRLLGGFANIEIPLGPEGFQPFLLGGVGAVDVQTDANSTGSRVSFNKASFNVGAGVRFKLGAIAGVLEARLNDVPSNDAKAYFKGVQTIPVTFGLVF
jgi:opacity protein-like surface antigen